jgi:hypothetical protein
MQHSAGIFKLLRSPEIDSKESIPPTYVACAEIVKQSMGVRNRVEKGLSYLPARLHDSLESIPGPLKNSEGWVAK